MILADTSIWIDLLRGTQPEMQRLLEDARIVMHPFIVAEVALVSLRNRPRTLALMESLWMVTVAQLEEVRRMIEAHNLDAQGLGLTDVHLLASCLITPGVQLWTRNTGLEKASAALHVRARVPNLILPLRDR